ncbi:hypothetical protein OG21DRAFT_1273259 [Imleria badia]|nr:hypothetical protein OG21DRAFT_1273259 [Imleria badia]
METQERTSGQKARTVPTKRTTESEDSTDEEDDGIASEESAHQQPRVRISRLLDSKPIIARPTRVTLQNMPVVDRPTGHNCVICTDPIHSVEIRAPCGHYYDIGCATDLFQSATRDETLFPPRCCGQNVPFGRIRPHLSPALITAFQQKKAEFSTLKRVYCSSPTCSRFLGPVSEGIFGGRVYSCPAPRCRRRTCGKCREQHSGDRTHVCRPDAGATQVLELSRASGWARCPGCSHMIELHLGCFHTTCRCGTEFCYLCRARWKTCECPQWDEQRLVVDEEEAEDEWHGLG